MSNKLPMTTQDPVREALYKIAVAPNTDAAARKIATDALAGLASTQVAPHLQAVQAVVEKDANAQKACIDIYQDLDVLEVRSQPRSVQVAWVVGQEAALASQRLERLDHPSKEAALPDVDALAQEIRRLDGAHNMGAGALAENLVEWMRKPHQALQEAGGWRDIATAPKDGTQVDLWHPIVGRLTDMWFDEEDQIWAPSLFETKELTHWMRIAAAPTQAQRSEKT